MEYKRLSGLTSPVIRNKIKAKHPYKKRELPEDSYAFKPEEEFQLKQNKIFPNCTRTQLRGRRD